MLILPQPTKDLVLCIWSIPGKKEDDLKPKQSVVFYMDVSIETALEGALDIIQNRDKPLEGGCVVMGYFLTCCSGVVYLLS